MSVSIEDAIKAPKFSLEWFKSHGIVTSVYDGDSIHVVFTFQETTYKWVCRLYGVDTPEIRTKNKQERILGIQVRDALRNKILHKQVDVVCGKFDKYGRLLITIVMDDENINEWLIANDYAYEYYGGSKRKLWR